MHEDTVPLEEHKPQETSLTVRPSPQLLVAPVMDIPTARQRLKDLQAFVKDYLVDGEDFGKIPGTPKPTLLKPGADKLCEIYGLVDTYRILNRTVDWITGLFDYEIECTLLSKRDGSICATGVGSCSSYEGKYRWRQSERVCPKCGNPTIRRGKAEYGGGWFCHGKSGGCGRKFKDGDPEIEGQKIVKVQNDDLATQKNTILKMAKKRAKIDATLGVTRSSGIFTQDVEDFHGHEEPASTLPTAPTGPTEPEGATLEDMLHDIDGLVKDNERFFSEKQLEDAEKFILDGSVTHEQAALKLRQVKRFVSDGHKKESKAKKQTEREPGDDQP
jgi:ribosomal protein L37AE/L43A